MRTSSPPQLLLAGDHTRGPGARPGAGPWKEWQHFVVLAPGVELIVNLNLATDLRPGGGGLLGRAIALARVAGRWQGAVVDDPAPRAPAGRLDVRIAGLHLVLEGGAYRLRGALPAAGLELDLALVPRTTLSLSTHMPFHRGERVDWLLVPRLAVGGVARLAGRDLPVAGALAYHDHNWGRFHWGADFAWEWGFVLPDDPACPWTVVMARLLDRSRTRVRSQGFFLWEGAHQRRIFMGRDVRFRPRGRATAEAFDLPPVMGLLAPGRVPGVPAGLAVSARTGGDHIDVDVDLDGISRILVPDEGGRAGLTLLAETTGRATVRGHVRGRDVRVAGRAIVELVRGEDAAPGGPLALETRWRRAAPDPPLPDRATPDLFAWLLEGALAAVALEQPAARDRLAALLGAHPVRFTVDGPPVTLSWPGGHPHLDRAGPAGALDLEASHAAVLALAAGEVRLARAVRRGDLDLRGPPLAVALFHDALLVFLHAAVRSRTLPALLARYRALVAGSAATGATPASPFR